MADHVTAGAFDSAVRLLQDQLGIIRIEPFKQHFLTAFARPVFVLLKAVSIKGKRLFRMLRLEYCICNHDLNSIDAFVEQLFDSLLLLQWPE